MDPSYEKNLELFKNSEFESIQRLVRNYKNDDRRKFGNEEWIYEFTLGKTPFCFKNKQ